MKNLMGTGFNGGAHGDLLEKKGVEHWVRGLVETAFALRLDSGETTCAKTCVCVWV